MRTASRHGASANSARVTITTPSFSGPHYTLSAPASVDEGQAVTVTVRRTNTNDGVSTALVEIRDSYNNIIGIYAAEFASSAARATITYTPEDDGQNISDRKVRARVADVGTSSENTFSVEWHTVNVTNTTS